MNPSVFQGIQKMLDQRVTTDPRETAIDVWLESPGGDAHTAYKLFLELQSRCAVLRAIVPDYAKSAATLLILGMDELHMAASAELGPLDAQIEHPDREGVRVSALDVAKALAFLGNYSVDYIVGGGNKILGSTGLPRAEVLRQMTHLAAALLEPMLGKLDPHLIHRASNQLEVATEYAIKMLRSRRLPPGDRHANCDERDLAEHLVEHYPAHEFVISRKEARRLPLPVKDAEKYDRWSELKLIHRAFHEGQLPFSEMSAMIQVWDEITLQKVADDFRDDDDEEETDGKKQDRSAEDGDEFDSDLEGTGEENEPADESEHRGTRHATTSLNGQEADGGATAPREEHG